MEIAEVESLVFGNAQYVRITTDNGLVGIGQTGCWGYPQAVHEMIQLFRPQLIGQDPMRIEHHWQRLYRLAPFRGSVLSGSVSAVDIALWDIKGQRLQAPIWELLGGRCRDKVRLFLLMGGETPEEVYANATAAVKDGFTAVKFDPVPKGYQDFTIEGLTSAIVERVAAAREAVGKDADVVLEIHRKLTPVQALPIAEAIAQFRPFFFEDPIQIDSIQSQAEIARRVSVPLAIGERMHTIWEFRELLVTGGCQFVRPDIGLAGGLTHCKKIAAVAESFHAAVVTHNFLGPILTAASVHLDVAIPNFIVQEYSKVDEGPAAAPFVGRLKRDGGYLPVPDAPGLGIRIDAALIPTAEPVLAITRPTPLRADGSVGYAM